MPAPEPVISIGGYTIYLGYVAVPTDAELVPEDVPRDAEDEWLRIHGDWDEGDDDG